MNKNLVFKLSQILVVLVLGFSFAIAHAKPESGDEYDHRAPYRKLLSSALRPTMQEVIDAFKLSPIPRNDIKVLMNHPWANINVQAIFTDLPVAIAKLELAYPGAIWGCLGRDAADIADLLDAFYMGMGHKGRVARVNVSRGTILNVDNALLMRMFKELGMDIDHSETMRPFILLDRTNYQSYSQSYVLMGQIYNYFTRTTGKPPSLLFSKVNMISSTSGKDILRPEEFFEDLQNQTDRAQAQFPIFIGKVAELAKFTDKTPWHETFMDLTTYPDGRIGGTIGRPEAEDKRTSIIETMIKSYQVVITKEFQDAVRAEAKKLGYDFDERLKMYGDAWVPPPAVPREPSIEELIEKTSDNFLTSLAKNSSLIKLTTYIKDTYKNEIAEVIRQKEIESGKQTIFERQKMIQSGFENLHGSLLQETKEFGTYTDFHLITLAFLKTLPPYEPYKKYFSDNAAKIDQMFTADLLKNQPGVRIVYYLTLLGAAKKKNIISSKDYRRLILYALALVPDNPQFYDTIPKVLNQYPELKETLIKHAKVFLTSGRNGKAAQTTYLTMIERNLLPKPNECDLWLDDKSEEDDLKVGED